MRCITRLEIGGFVVQVVRWCCIWYFRSSETRLVSNGAGGVAFSTLARICGECSTIHSPPALFFFSFKVEISSRTLILLFRPGSVHSGSARPSAPLQIACELVSWQVPLCLDSGIVSPLRLHWVKGVCVFRWTCHLHFWQNGSCLLRATARTRGWNGHRIRVSTQSWLWRRKFSRRSCRDSNSQLLCFYLSSSHYQSDYIIQVILIMG